MSNDNKKLEYVISINQYEVKKHPRKIVRSTIDEILDAKTDRLGRTKRYERSGAGRTSGPIHNSGGHYPDQRIRKQELTRVSIRNPNRG